MTLETALRFPAKSVLSHASFQELRENDSDIFDERYRREQSLATRHSEITLPGTCAVCLEVTCFHSPTVGGSATADGHIVPNWRETQRCACEDRLNSRERALLHLGMPHLEAWAPPASLGASPRFARRLTAMAPAAQHWPAFAATAGALALPAQAGSLTTIFCPDHLQSVPLLDAALAELARILMPGGILLFTVPLAIAETITKTDLSRVPTLEGRPPPRTANQVHVIGWDIQDRAHQAGFADCIAHCYWSEELGYLGPYNLAFLATR